ncbi:hypothetical protein LCGC14_3037050, partial [marine sediment metagenome]
MSEYQLTILDKDGEEHQYNFFADYPLEIAEYVLNRMRKGDFYGHEHLQTQDISVCELVKGTLIGNIIDVRCTRGNCKRLVLDISMPESFDDLVRLHGKDVIRD